MSLGEIWLGSCWQKDSRGEGWQYDEGSTSTTFVRPVPSRWWIKCCMNTKEWVAVTLNLKPNLESHRAIQEKYKSDNASLIKCCIDITEGMAVTWTSWPNLESYKATQETTRVTLQEEESLPWLRCWNTCPFGVASGGRSNYYLVLN